MRENATRKDERSDRHTRYSKPTVHDDGDVRRGTNAIPGDSQETNVVWGNPGPIRMKPAN
jgi:hypothetical protein